MPVTIEMPKLSDTMTEGTLVRWLKKEGDNVAPGDVLAEIETDKATMEMESFDEGVLHRIYVSEGEKVPLGGRLAVLLEEGEDAPDDSGDDAESTDSGDGDEAADSGDDKETASPSQPGTDGSRASPAPSGSDGRRIKASPLARRLAREHNIDLTGLSGSGPGGRIVKKDVLSARPGKSEPAAGPDRPGSGAAPIRPAVSDADQRIPLSSMRSIIAERLLISKTTIPHFYLHAEVDAAPLMKLRKQLNAPAEKDPEAHQFTVNDFVLMAVISACRAVPQANAAFDGDAIVQFAGVHLAVAVALDDGLVTPVIREAENRSLRSVSLAVKDLAARAKAKKLKPEELSGGTVTVSSLGAWGVDFFDAIINPPQALIVSVGRIRKVPVVDEEERIVPGLRMDVGLSCDHRTIDGAIGARFLSALKEALENPALMLLSSP